MTDLLERYVQAVGRYLPAATKCDTLAELRANLLAEMDDRSESLGRPLTEAEEAEILRGHGHPSVVAANYQPRRSLIGPELFPYYWLTMRRALPFVVGIFAVSRAAELIYGPPQTAIAVTSVLKLVAVLFYFFGWMTLLFAAVELIRTRYPQKVTLHADWDPRKLARVEPEERRNLPKHPVADLIFSAIFTLLLLAFPRYPYLLLGPGAWYLGSLSIVLGPVWHTLYWALVALSCVQLVFKTIALFPAAVGWRRPMKVIEQLAGLGILTLFLRTREYLVLTKGTVDLDRGHIAAILNIWIHRSAELVFVVVALLVIWNMGRLLVEATRHEAVTAIKH